MANGGNNKPNTDFDLKKVSITLMVVILSVVFTLGYLCSENRKGESVKFTYEEIQMIENFQKEVTKSIGDDTEVIVYKDKNGLKLSWE